MPKYSMLSSDPESSSPDNNNGKLSYHQTPNVDPYCHQHLKYYPRFPLGFQAKEFKVFQKPIRMPQYKIPVKDRPAQTKYRPILC